MNEDKALRKRLYNLFDPNDVCRNDFYVPLDAARGHLSVIDTLARKICDSDKPLYQLLAGHHGSGKSSELIRLKEKLKTGDDKYFVVLFDIAGEGNIDRQDVEFPEILIAIISHLANDIKAAFNKELGDTYFKSLFKDIGDILTSTVDFSGVELTAGFVKLSGALSKNPDLRKKLRDKMVPITNQWIDATNSFIDDANTTILNNGYKGLVIIVDGLDKLILSSDTKRQSCAKILFDDWGVQLRSLNCHMIYTMPIALAYSIFERKISSSFGIPSPPVIPMTKLFDDKGKRTIGFERFIEIVRKRIDNANAAIEDVFKNGMETLEYLIEKSGGQPRELMVLIREGMAVGDLPISKKDIDIAARGITNSYSRQLYKEHWIEIETVRKNHHFNVTEANDRIRMELLDMRAVLQYRNGEEWYGLNPLLPGNPNKTKTE